VTSLEQPERADAAEQGDREDPVPIFGSWGRMYTAVIVCAIAVMGLVAVFSHYDY
jgi:hypothetical protein